MRRPVPGSRLARLLSIAAAMLAAIACSPAAASAAGPPHLDPFYQYEGSRPLAEITPGTVLKTRTLSYHVLGIKTPLKTIQLLHRATDMLGAPTVNITSVLLPPKGTPKGLVAYQSFYDSLNPADGPSYAMAGGTTFGGAVNGVEGAFIVPFLSAGYAVTVSDTQGLEANFAAGPEYGMNTLDGIRATLASPDVGLPASTKVGMWGYSGGAIATGWAAELAPEYAPDVDARLVGAAYGGVLVHPAHNLHYIDGSAIWAGVMPMAIIGAARSFDIDLQPYLSSYGQSVYNRLKNASIANVLGAWPGLTWKRMAKPEYAAPESVPVYVDAVNRLIMGSYGTPTTPLYIGQGTRGDWEGTPNNKPGIGPGDGVMIAGDVRQLAREFCDRGADVLYREYGSSHVGAMTTWGPGATTWLLRRFAGSKIDNNCSTIKPGNSLAPVVPIEPAAAR